MEQINANRQEPVFTLDAGALKDFVQFFKTLGEKPITTVRFFDFSDYYTVHGSDDCDLIARLIYKSTAYIHNTSVHGTQQDKLSYVTLSKWNFENAVRDLLLVRNYRVEVYTKRSIGNTSEWNLEYRGSPGNLLQFEDILFANREVLVGNCVLALYCQLEGNQRKIGVAAIEQNDCVFQISEFIDDDFYTELEAIIVLLGPKECLIPADLGSEYDTIKTILSRNGAMVSMCRKSKTSNSNNDIIRDLNRLIRFEKGQHEDANGLIEVKLNLAMDALTLGIKYLDLLNDSSNLGQYQIKQLDLKRFVHLDSAALNALNVLPKHNTQYASTYSTSSHKWHSILGVLDRCRTPQGHRLMSQWIKQPLRNRDILNDRHNIVECLLEAPDSLKILHDDYLKRIPDILMLTKKLLRNKANLQDLFRIYQVILRIPKIITTLVELDNDTVQSVLADPLKSYLEDLKGLKQMVEQVMDFEALENGEYLVKASFDNNLEYMKERMDILLRKMERLRDKANADLQLENNQGVRLENISQIGYYFRITLKDDASLRKNKSYEVMHVIKGGVRFTSEKLKELSSEFGEIRLQYEEQQKTIVAEIIKVALGYVGPLTTLNNHFAQLDCLVSFGIVAQSAPKPYVRPKMLCEGSGELVLKELRHPCLELQEHISYIPNDVEFKADVCNMLIITGPNMGGKSTYIRSVGTAVLMAHIGSFVPCAEATITMVDAILGRVGASDNIIKGLSTFMVEMIETSGIIRTATNNSLVIIDELGRGTSTYEGCGIAWSIAEYLATQTKCFSMFATHFHEITELANYSNTVKNCHMAAIVDNENFTLLYTVKPTPMKKSFGIQIAKLADFPTSVIDKARNIYKQFDDEHVSLQTLKDQELIDKINNALEQLYVMGNDANIHENDLKELVDKFSKDIQQLDSEYFKAITKETN